jgi:nucleolar pre-ribosomal-associated protein 1
LKYYVASHEGLLNNRVRTLLHSAIDDIGIFTLNKTDPSLEVLISSLQRRGQRESEASLFEFLDQCLTRVATKPVKYYDDLMATISRIRSPRVDAQDCNVGLLLVAIFEQWPFLVKSAPSHTLRTVTRWLSCYLDFSEQAGENMVVLTYFRNEIEQKISDDKARALLRKSMNGPAQLCSLQEPSILHDRGQTKANGLNTPITPPETIETETLLPPIPPEEVGQEHFSIDWTKKDVVQATLDGDVGTLVLHLCSNFEEVRKQALNNLRVILGNLEVGPPPSGMNMTKESRNQNLASGSRRMCFLEKSSTLLRHKTLCHTLQVLLQRVF